MNVPNLSEELLEKDLTVRLHYNDGWCGEILEQKTVDCDKPSEVEISPATLNTENQNGISVILTHFDTPNEFYLQLSEAAETVEKLQADLQTAAPHLADLENPSAGVLCAAPYSLDQMWYRAQVLDADADITTVRFVDYGNTDVLENGVTFVKTLPSDLLMLEQHARRCSLNVRSSEEEWSPVALQKFQELTTNTSLTVISIFKLI